MFQCFKGFLKLRTRRRRHFFFQKYNILLLDLLKHNVTNEEKRIQVKLTQWKGHIERDIPCLATSPPTLLQYTIGFCNPTTRSTNPLIRGPALESNFSPVLLIALANLWDRSIALEAYSWAPAVTFEAACFVLSTALEADCFASARARRDVCMLRWRVCGRRDERSIGDWGEEQLRKDVVWSGDVKSFEEGRNGIWWTSEFGMRSADFPLQSQG